MDKQTDQRSVSAAFNQPTPEARFVTMGSGKQSGEERGQGIRLPPHAPISLPGSRRSQVRLDLVEESLFVHTCD